MIVLKRERISRHDGDPYLTRWILFRCPWFAVYVHRFEAPDDECLHDHPWPFLSVILRGGYRETFHAGRRLWQIGGRFVDQFFDGERVHTVLSFGAGSVLWRPAEHAHRVDAEGGTLSLVITGRRVRRWGFFTRLGWLHWKDYRYAEHCS
jgi:hypothetical protein